MHLLVVNISWYEHRVGGGVGPFFALSHLGVVALETIHADAYAVLVVHVGIGYYVVLAFQCLALAEHTILKSEAEFSVLVVEILSTAYGNASQEVVESLVVLHEICLWQFP